MKRRHGEGDHVETKERERDVRSEKLLGQCTRLFTYLMVGS